MIITAKPTADSLAAIAKTKREKSCPYLRILEIYGKQNET
jgi:hypothetical protein